MIRRLFHTPAAADQVFSNARAQGWARLAVVSVTLISCILSNYIYHLWVTIRTGLLPEVGWHYLIIPILVFGIVLRAGVRAIMYAYRIKGFRQATAYLLAALFDFSMPTLLIRNGELQTVEGVENPIERIGGPGFIFLHPGSVLLVENLNGETRVFGSGRHFISRHENVKEAANLEEIDAKVDRASATTKDGIPVEVLDIHFRYRIATDENAALVSGLQSDHPYSYSDDTVRRVVYSRAMTAEGVIPWEKVIKGVISSTITGYISRHNLDQLTAPGMDENDQTDPRDELYNYFKSETFKKSFREKGAELKWIDIGYFENPQERVVKQRISTWQAKWIGSANMMRAYGESRRKTYQELGRAEGQARILTSIVYALQDVQPKGVTGRGTRTIYLARLAQLLEAMQPRMIDAGDNQPERGM